MALAPISFLLLPFVSVSIPLFALTAAPTSSRSALTQPPTVAVQPKTYLTTKTHHVALSQHSSFGNMSHNGIKWCQAYSMICAEPGKWFRGARIEDRDRALLTGDRATFVEYSQGTFVRKIYHMERSQGFSQTEFTVEEDINCKQMIQSAGGQLYGFDLQPHRPTQWASMTVNVNIKSAEGGDFDWGFLSTGANNIRIFKGPPETCDIHPWDAMILRDCTPNTTSLYDVEHIASRKWDILAMKMCEDFDHPWVVVSVQDAGPAPLASVCNLP